MASEVAKIKCGLPRSWGDDIMDRNSGHTSVLFASSEHMSKARPIAQASIVNQHSYEEIESEITAGQPVVCQGKQQRPCANTLESEDSVYRCSKIRIHLYTHTVVSEVALLEFH